jgi:hypothetical protein
LYLSFHPLCGLVYQNPLDLAEQLNVAPVGIPSFFGYSKVSVEWLLNLMGFPTDSFNLYISSSLLHQSFVASLASIRSSHLLRLASL